MDNNIVTSAGPFSYRGAATLRAWAIVSVLLLLYALSITDRQIISILATSIKRDLSLTDTELGLIQGLAFSLVYGTAGIGLAWVADRYSRRLVVFSGVIIWSISCSLGGVATSFRELFISRIGVAFGEAGLNPASHSIIKGLFKADRLAAPIAFYSMGGTLGTGFSFFAGAALLKQFEQGGGVFGELLAHHSPWQAALIVIGLPGLALAGLSFLIPKNAAMLNAHTVGLSPAPQSIFVFIRANRAVLFYHLVAFALMIMNTYSLLAWTPAYLERSMSLNPSTLGTPLFIIFGVCPAIGGIGFGLLIDHLFARGRTTVYFGCMIFVAILEALTVILAFTVHGFDAFYLFLAIRGLASGATLVCGGAALQLITPPSYAARMSAIYLFAIAGIGGGLGPFLVGLVTEHVLDNAALVGTSMMAVVATSSILAAMLFITGLKTFRAAVTARTGAVADAIL